MSDVTGVSVSDVLGLSEPITKLIETVKDGVGKVYEPTHIRRMAKAKAAEIKLIGDALQENSAIPCLYQNGEISMDATDIEGLAKRAQDRLAWQEMNKQQNIESVIGKAYNLLENEKEVSQQPVDNDWIMRFFNSVQDVRNEDMQKLWAKILAGEIKRPSNFSLRTLDILHNISAEEARLFEKVCSFSIESNDHRYLLGDPVFYKDYYKTDETLFYEDILRLNECGLIAGNGMVGANFTCTREAKIALRNRIYVLAQKSNFDQPISFDLHCYAFTLAGREIFSLLDDRDNDAFFFNAMSKITERLCLPLGVFKILEQNGDNYTFDSRVDYIADEGEK